MKTHSSHLRRSHHREVTASATYDGDGIAMTDANDNGTGARTTSYSYTWYTDSQQVQSITTTLPVVSDAQNGPGTASTRITWFDSHGRPKRRNRR